MKAITTRSVPRLCPECGSEKLGGLASALEDGGNAMLCHGCGLWMQIGEVPNIDLTAGLFICPHCKTAGAIEVMGGEEWCNGCGLDPNIQDYTSPTLSHLWKTRSGIQRVMQQGRALLKPDRDLGRFLRTRCGPHCLFAETCPQETGDLVQCYKEKCPNTPTGGDMSRKSRKARKQRKQERRREREAVLKDSRKALVECASSSWFEKVLYANSLYPEQIKNKGGGSGT